MSVQCCHFTPHLVCILHRVEVCISCTCFHWNSGAVLDRESHTATSLKRGLSYKERTFQCAHIDPSSDRSVSSDTTASCGACFLPLVAHQSLLLFNAGLGTETLQYYHPKLSFDLSGGQACDFAKSRSRGRIGIKTTA